MATLRSRASLETRGACRYHQGRSAIRLLTEILEPSGVARLVGRVSQVRVRFGLVSFRRRRLA